MLHFAGAWQYFITSPLAVINESDLVEFLKKNPEAKIATDVLTDEIRDRKNSPLFKYALENDNVIITQHIGGMTREAQEIAYGHVATLLKKLFLQSGIQII